MTPRSQVPPPIVLTALGHFHPENVIDNDFFDRLEIDSDANWVIERTGIMSRRSVLSDSDIVDLRHGTTTLAKLRAEGRVMSLAEMAERAYAHTKTRLKDPAAALDAVICGTSIPDYDIPANASAIAGRIGLTCPAFDANSACSSFVLDLHVARALIAAGTYKRVGIFNPERYSLRMNYADKKTCVLFGDGSTAGVLEATDHGSGGLQLLDTIMESDPSRFDVVKIPCNGHFDQNGSAVQKFAITRTIEITRTLMERNHIAASDLSFFTGHQANLRMVTSAAEKLGLPPEKHLFNVDHYGNQGSAGAPSVLSMNWHRFSPGDLIAVAVVGAGLTWGAALFRRI